MSDYSQKERDLLLHAERVFFPTPRFSMLFKALEKPTFPSATTYHYQRSRTIQQLLTESLGLAHPRTRIYYGKRQKDGITEDFSFPMVVMGSKASPDSIHLVNDIGALNLCAEISNPILVREAAAWVERVCFLCVNYRVLGAQRLAPDGVNPSSAEPISLDLLHLKEPLSATMDLVRKAELDDIVIEWGYGDNHWQILGMSRPPVRWETTERMLNRTQYICELIQSGVL